MKSSYKIALFLAAALCLVVVFYYANQGAPDQGDGSVNRLPDPAAPSPPAASPLVTTPPAEAPAPEAEEPDLTRNLLNLIDTAKADPEPEVPEIALGTDEPTAATPPEATPAEATTTPETRPTRPNPFADFTSTPPTTTAPPPPPAETTYTIKAGDTFGSIAQEKLGAEKHWIQIAQANPRVDPQRLQVGQIIRLPSRASLEEETTEPEAAAPEATVSYKVRPGDTLSAIAQEYYGDPTQWRYIYNANRGKIGSDPARIKAGMVLTIPPAPRAAE